MIVKLAVNLRWRCDGSRYQRSARARRRRSYRDHGHRLAALAHPRGRWNLFLAEGINRTHDDGTAALRMIMAVLDEAEDNT